MYIKSLLLIFIWDMVRQNSKTLIVGAGSIGLRHARILSDLGF